VLAHVRDRPLRDAMDVDADVRGRLGLDPIDQLEVATADAELTNA
jgi:hypothetical protein